MQKIAICASSHGMYWQSEKNLLDSSISSTCPHNMVNLRPTNGWDQLVSLGHPSKFQRVLPLGFVTAPTSPRYCTATPSSLASLNADCFNLSGAGLPRLSWKRGVKQGACCKTALTRVPCSNAAKTRNPLKLSGVPQTNETISAASGPKFTVLWGHVEEILLLNKFFPIVDTCLSCEDIARQNCAMVARWRFWQLFWVLHLQRAACSTFQTCIPNSQ